MKYYVLTEEGKIKWLEMRLGGSSGLTKGEEAMLRDIEAWSVFFYDSRVCASWVGTALSSLVKKGLVVEYNEST